MEARRNLSEDEGSDTPPVGVAFEGDDDSFCEEQILTGVARVGHIYNLEREAKRKAGMEETLEGVRKRGRWD